MILILNEREMFILLDSVKDFKVYELSLSLIDTEQLT